jgi:hypothetical protein
MKNTKNLACIVGVAAALVLGLCPIASADDEGFTPLFDGKTTDGWHKPYDWGKAWVEGGTIHLQGDKKFFLVTDKPYADFILEVEVNVPVGGNSGIQFRSHYKQNWLWGYQAEVDTSKRKWAGGLYDEGRRGWLVPLKDKPQAQAAFKNGQWNKYRVRAQGDHLQIWVNGVLTTDFHDKRDADGYIALQHHGEKGRVYQFRNIRIKLLPKEK